MSANATDVEHSFLTRLIENNGPVTMFLKSGIKLEGYIAQQDKYSVMMTGKSQQLIYKHSISTIQSSDAGENF